MQFEKIGKPLRRRENTRLLTGRGLFSDDWAIDGQTHMFVIRSSHAHTDHLASVGYHIRTDVYKLLVVRPMLPATAHFKPVGIRGPSQ